MAWWQRMQVCIRVGWQLIREVGQVIYGLYQVLKLPRPCVTIFGGVWLAPESPYARQAFELAQKLVQLKISVLTGGGPGVMEAANCGAASAAPEGCLMSMGIGISEIPNEAGLNPCVCKFVVLDYFFARKWLLTNYSDGFVLFPGGLGTIDELSDLLNLIHTGRREPVPVILVGTEFWAPYVQWLEHATQQGLIRPRVQPLVVITDDLKRVLQVLQERTT